MGQTVSLSFFRLPSVADRAWALWMMGAARRPLAKVADIGFWKLCGSGTGVGFSPTLFPQVIAILATWPSEAIARDRTATAPIFRKYAERASETWTVFLSPETARGNWSGVTPFEPSGAKSIGPLAALTRATVRPGIMSRFWGRVPRISEIIGQDPNVIFKIGIGEVPLLQQVTFSIWPSEQAMAAFARTGAHSDAIRAVRTEGWFREELYARFTIQSDSGTWGGTSPLAALEAA
ncbi:spheroidene monooxygenase [Cognatiyoonia koreensis]|uniref:Spheroidene monooxygenase n=1 Tax=Cognatiyoonia koreensis TaxID=364200 RepID=A0A1I0RRN7_9RHOB|nr:spheroidene monooxygenase [Cognatiyoonia koreensis]SEW43844.1 spheroidene monooxygenase [Cognatiyoonia koreensis]